MTTFVIFKIKFYFFNFNLFSEAFIGGYPKGLNFGVCMGTRNEEGRDEFKAYHDSAITYDGTESQIIAKCARQNYVHIAVGVIERSGNTLYCSVVILF